MARSIIAIVGRPNVGKSTLFNRIVGQRMAIVEDTPGVTRDRLYANSQWLDRDLIVIDTGGITDHRDPIQIQIQKQVEMAIEEADSIIMVVDGRASLTNSDHQVAQMLRKTKKPVVLAVNKVEDFRELIDPEVYALGLGDPVLISAEHGKNIGDLLDLALVKIPKAASEEENDLVKVTFVGRPNVGKSSLVNALLGEERVIVSDQPGTTRDAIDTPITINDRHYLLVDTAGIRRKSKVEASVEYYSVIRALRAIERSDVVVLVLDATMEIAEQDLKIAGFIVEAGKAGLILVNKWDLIEKDETSVRNYTEKIQRDLNFLDFAPVLFVSAKTGQRLPKVIPLINQIMEAYTFRIPTNRLNQVISEAVAMHHLPSDKGRILKIYYTNQIKVKPPTFLFTMNNPSGLHFSYRRYLENKLRETFEFTGTPLVFHYKSSNKNLKE